MLHRILTLILSGRAATQVQLAQLLDVSESLVAQMVDQLVANGYLEEAVLCAAGCQGCSLEAACGSSGDPQDKSRDLRLWSLTEKGRRAVAQ